jgi:hypothetical protein
MEPIKDNSIQPIDKTLNDIISGRFEYNCLPSLNPRLIRLFICAPSDGLNFFKIFSSLNCFYYVYKLSKFYRHFHRSELSK